MNTEQERAEFEAWLYQEQVEYESDDLNKREIEIARFAYQAGRAALQPQDAEDAERLDWIETIGSVDIVKTLDGKTEVYAPDDDLIYATGTDLRDAIDHARRGEGDGE